MYQVEVTRIDDDGYYRNLMIIKDSHGDREYRDGGEPEDNSFVRDWEWVKDELFKAYEQGKRDAIAATHAGE